MISLCQPYGLEITCLCDDTASVLRCFLTSEEGDSVNHIQEDMDMVTNYRGNIHPIPTQQQSSSSVHPNKMVDMKTEMILAGAIILLVIVLIFW